MVDTTLRKIFSCNPETALWERLLKSLEKTSLDDEPIPIRDLV